jgi:hypothetical protein
MNNDMLDYYLALLQVQMAIVGFVIAGIVALIQLINGTKPRRETRLLLRYRVLVPYIGFLVALLGAMALACWVMTVPDSASARFGQSLVNFYEDGGVLLGFLVLTIVGLLFFAYLTYKSRTLLDPNLYLKTYIRQVPPQAVREYLQQIYTDPGVTVAQLASSHQKARDISNFKRYFEREQDIYDPFQPIREYIKDNAFKLYDFGTAAGLKLFSQLFDKTLTEISKQPQPDEHYYLAKYLSESSLEFFAIFVKTSSEKRKMDMIRMVYSKGQMLLEAADAEGLLTVVRCLEGIAKMTDDDDEIMAAVGYIHALTDAYLERHEGEKWEVISVTFEEICLSVTRLSETYYLQKDNPLKTVPIIGHYTGEYRTVTAALVDFFESYKDLADRYTDAYPVHYFEAIEAVVEALFARLADFVDSNRGTIGLNQTYHDLAYALYSQYSIFGLDAIEHKKPELLALGMGNLRRVVKPAKNLRLEDERTKITRMFIELAINGIEELGDIPLKGERTISMYALETLKKHGSHRDITDAFTALHNTITPHQPASLQLEKALKAIKES